MFNVNPPTDPMQRRGTQMISVTGACTSEQSRPKGIIVGKDHYPGSRFESLSLLANGQLLAGYKAGTIGSPMGAQIRDTNDFRLIREIKGAAPPFAVDPSGNRLLAFDGYINGAAASMQLVAIESGKVLERFPLRQPFVWIDEDRFIAELPDIGIQSHWSGGSPGVGKLTIEENVLKVDPQIAGRHPYLDPFFRSHRVLLVIVDWRHGKVQAVAENEMKRSFLGLGQLIRTADATTVFYHDQEEVGSIDMETSKIRWRQRLGTKSKTDVFSLYALALSHDEKRLAAGGIAGGANQGRSLMILDSANGRIVHEAPFTRTIARLGIKRVGNTSIQALAWHPAGWLAVGTSAGIVAHIDSKWQLRGYLGAGKEVRAMAFVHDGRSLLLAGSEKNFRLWDLLEDER